MPTPPVLDFDALLAPIPGDNPAGEYLRDADRAAYDAIRGGYRQARSAEERASPEEGGAAVAGLSEWRDIKPAAISALTERTKDLDLCCFLIEAMTRLDGAAGLRDGFRLVRELVERYWDHLYPLPEDGDIYPRVAILAGLNGDMERPGTLPTAITRLTLACPPGGSTMYFTDYHDGVAQAKKNPEAPDPLEGLKSAIRATDGQYLLMLRDDLKDAAAEFRKMTETLDERCGSRAPGSTQIARELEKCLDILLELAGDRLAETEASTPTTESGGTQAGPAAQVGGAVRGREDAFRTLLQVAAYFDQAEPHSVIPHALRQIVRWGKMSLPQLLLELIPDSGSRESLFKQVGIQPPDNPSS